MPVLCITDRSRPMLVLAFALTLAMTFAPVEALARWALVVGVADYEDPAVPDLNNTVNDARTMSSSLNNMGFKVYYVENPTKADMQAAVERLGREQAGADLGLFYFAGHGLQVDGVNYALPSDITPRGADFLSETGISITDVISDLKDLGTENLVVILDSCRNSPFEDRAATGAGLALVDAPENTIIAYSTAPGEIALDGTGANSPYTAALAAALEGPEQDIRDVLRLVRARVRLATRGAQTPWFVDNSRGQIVIQPRAAAETDGLLEQLTDGAVSFATTAWKTIANSSDPRDFELFAELYPESELAPIARRQLVLIQADNRPEFPLMDLGVPERNPVVPNGLGSVVTACDVLATGVGDGMGLVEPVPHDLVNTGAALRACIEAVTLDPENPRLLGLLARVLRLEERFDESLHYYELSAARGNASAWGGIASAYRQGWGVEIDLPRAAEAARTGALLGSVQMRLFTSIFYREGWGVQQSFVEAKRWTELATLGNYPPALVAYGDYYRKGRGIPKEPARAIEYYRQAAVLGSTDAMNLIGLAYMKGEGVEQDTNVGIRWLSQASEQGNPYAAFHLGRAFRDGWGVEKDPNQALAYFRLSAQRNYLGAYTHIGDVLQSGESPDLAEAYANYVIAREAGRIRDTADSREDQAEAEAKLAELSTRMNPADRAAGERIASDWISQYGLLDFHMVNE